MLTNYVGLRFFFEGTVFTAVVTEQEAISIRQRFIDNSLPKVLEGKPSRDCQERFGVGPGWQIRTELLLGIDYFDPYKAVQAQQQVTGGLPPGASGFTR